MARRWRAQVGTLAALVAMLVTPSMAAAGQEHVTGDTWAGQAAVSSYPRLRRRRAGIAAPWHRHAARAGAVTRCRSPARQHRPTFRPPRSAAADVAAVADVSPAVRQDRGRP